jgi:hypothetical protein
MTAEARKITSPISDDAKEIGKSGVELVLPDDGQRSYPLHYH